MRIERTMDTTQVHVKGDTLHLPPMWYVGCPRAFVTESASVIPLVRSEENGQVRLYRYAVEFRFMVLRYDWEIVPVGDLTADEEIRAVYTFLDSDWVPQEDDLVPVRKYGLLLPWISYE